MLPTDIGISKGNPELLEYVNMVLNSSVNAVVTQPTTAPLKLISLGETNELFISGADNGQMIRLSIYNILGANVFNGEILSGEKINAPLKKGMYIYRIQANMIVSTGKILIR
jgi:hypothetical protein